MKPTTNNIFVVETEQETTTLSGIVLTGDITTGSKPGKVIYVGPDATVSPGDQVFVRWSDALAVTYKGQKGALISMESVLAVL